MKGRIRNHRLTAFAGLGYVVVYFAYVVMLNPPDISTSSHDTVVYWADSGNQAQSIIAATLCGLAVLLLVGFVVGLAKRLDDGGAASAAQGVRIGGGVTATLLLTGGAVFASPALALALNNESVPMDDELGLAIRASSLVAHPLMLWFAGLGAAAVVAATTAGSAALGWHRWTRIVGTVLVVALLAPLVFFGLLLFLLWTAVISVSMLRSNLP
jgi:hypothetical protein